MKATSTERVKVFIKMHLVVCRVFINGLVVSDKSSSAIVVDKVFVLGEGWGGMGWGSSRNKNYKHF